MCHLSQESKDFAAVEKIVDLAKKFSSFVSFPISVSKDPATRTETPDAKTEEDIKIVQDALWLRPSSGITADEHRDFFRYALAET